MTRHVSIVVAYPADSDFDDVLGIIEREFMIKLDVSEHRRVGAWNACMINVRVPNGFALDAVQRRLDVALPAVSIGAMERFPESLWARHRWGIAVAIGGGLAVSLIVDLLRLLLDRLREPPG